MPKDWSPLIVAVVAATLAFLFGLWRLSREAKVQRNEELRRRRADTYAAFCAAAIEYRRAQLHRWNAHQDRLGSPNPDDEPPELSEEVRSRRAVAWSRYYEVLMICNDAKVAAAANAALQDAAKMRRSVPKAELQPLSDLVHEKVRLFAVAAGESVRARRQGAGKPPPGVLPARVPAG
jgi:hypothetical protein